VPAPIAPLVGFVLGVVFAWAAADDLGRAGGVATRSLLVVSAFSLAVYAPISGYFLAFAPDWSYVYLVDSQRLPGAVDLGLVLMDAASVPVGFAAAARWARARRAGPILRMGAVPAAAALLTVLITLRRLGVHATYAQFHGDFGVQSVSGSPLGYALLWMTLVLVGAVGFTLSWLRRASRAARRN
jgi:hypothetical protein